MKEEFIKVEIFEKINFWLNNKNKMIALNSINLLNSIIRLGV